MNGVPKEVRKANPDGTTTFLRPMPGSARMYPETDAKSAEAVTEGLTLPQLITEKADSYEALGIGRELAHTLIREGAEQFFEQMAEEFINVNNSFIAEVIVSYAKEMEKRGLDHTRITDEHLKAVFSALNSGAMAKESVMDALAGVAAGNSLDLEKHRTMSDSELEKELKKIAAENKELQLSALIGKAMGKLRGKAPGQKIVETLKKITN